SRRRGMKRRSDPRARGITRLRNAENLRKLGIRQGHLGIKLVFGLKQAASLAEDMKVEVGFVVKDGDGGGHAGKLGRRIRRRHGAAHAGLLEARVDILVAESTLC